MTSRLDRLFLLLDTGSSPVTRKAAAQQLGEVQKLHPHELHNLLAKVRKYLHSPSWDTRIAAGQAVEAIIQNVPEWCPTGIPKQEDNEFSFINASHRLQFKLFDIHKVIQHGSDLLASEGKEFEAEDLAGTDDRERLMRQRQQLNKRLGLDMAEQIGIDTSEIFSTEDLQMKMAKNGETAEKKDLAVVFQSEMSQLNSGSKYREQARAKRRMRYSNSVEAEDEATSLKKKKMSGVESPIRENSENLWEESKEWPFEAITEELAQDLFNPSWEVRHGAATGLREIARLHGQGAGKSTYTPVQDMELANQLVLEDISLRLLCVLALDKFGDFISDEVVAPVRETCAQTLGHVLNIMSRTGVEGVLHVVLQLLTRPEWEARHGGLLGLKYLLAVRKDMTSDLMPLVFESIFRGLQDPNDDVSAVAASALIPVTDSLVKTLPSEVPRVITKLWDALLELDDLTSSTSSILMLLASLLSYSLPDGVNGSSPPLNTYVPRLWQFLFHSSFVVRKSVLQSLTILTSDSNPQPPREWLPPILADALRLLYQRCLVEHSTEILDLLYKVWSQIITSVNLPDLLTAACPYLSGWLCLLMHPAKFPVESTNAALWLEVRSGNKDRLVARGRRWNMSDGEKEGVEQYYIGGSMSLSEAPPERERFVLQSRCMAAKFLGLLSCYVTQPMPGVVYNEGIEHPMDCYTKLILFHLKSKSALQRTVTGMVISEWAKAQKDLICPQLLKDKVLECLTENMYYDEIASLFTRMQQECRDFMALLKHTQLPLESVFQAGTILTMDQAISLATSVFTALVQNVKLKPKVMENLEIRRKSLLRTVNQTSKDQVTLSTMVQACLAGVLISLKFLPEKLNPVIRPLMESVKREERKQLQHASAEHLVNLLDLCISREPCPNPKIVKNLTAFLCSDTSYSPAINPISLTAENSCDRKGSSGTTASGVSLCTKHRGILTHVFMQKSAEKVSFRRANSVNAKKSVPAQIDVPPDDASVSDDEAQQMNQLQRKGASRVFSYIASYFGYQLPLKLPHLWESIFLLLQTRCAPDAHEKNFVKEKEESVEDAEAQELVTSLLLLEVTGPNLHPDLFPQLEAILPNLSCALEHPYTAVRHMAARCLGMLSKVITTATMNIVLEKVLVKFGATDCDTKREGAMEALANIIEKLELDIVPYIVFLVVPTLGRMSDQNENVRLMATHCFASLVRLMPLEGGIKNPVNLSPELSARKAKEKHFLEQLMNSKHAENYEVPVTIKAELRSYQQEGVNWLAFLNKYKLHGILCDDMGLGKTLQSICILAADHYYREQEYKKNNRPDCRPLPSLVVCPPTLTGHWVYEVEKFVSSKHLNPLHYTGPPAERMRLQGKAKKHNLIIASYDIVRNDIDFFSTFHWNYCILDEGHIIKNGRTKLAKAIKQLSASHRLILSGTPIQNNVLELWSLFDFLMPGFLGTEKQFMARYSKPILQSRDAKSSSKEQEAGVLAMESLHRQVLPFLLRRMKDDVLKDLPPKIIQDYFCELSSLQVQLYEDFAKSQAKAKVNESLLEDEEVNVQNTTHVFQALQYLRKVCNHPKLVLNPQHPEYERIFSLLNQQNSPLSDISHAAKLCALRQLLLDCGIGTAAQPDQEQVVHAHRALIFCQLKGMLDILEKDLLKAHMPSVSYVRLDGSIPPSQRHSVVHRFNNDPSIDLMLLTTQVGGLGLNLTGADTVIFVEHDWNPMKDLQAMDRAHRIGQKKVVNVYRLITRGTLEEKIMGLQKFKLTVANAVISQENSSLQTMGTDQLLDLFTLDDKKKGMSAAAGSNSSSDKSSKGMRAMLDNLPELWDSSQYESEYDMGNFMKSLHSKYSSPSSST